MSLFRSCATASLALVSLAAAVFYLLHEPAHHTGSGAGWQSGSVHVADGVEYHYFPEQSELVAHSSSDALVLDLDLAAHGVHLQVAADSIERRQGGKVFGAAHTVQDWCMQHQAIAGINGGFFGATDGAAKQAEGLLVVDGKVFNTGRWIKSTRKPGESFVRCAFGLGSDGTPHIGWATCQPDCEMLMYERPLSPAGSRSFKVRSAVACGPRLIAAGKESISDTQERLVSSAALPRTFVAYDYDSAGGTRRPRHFVMGIAMQMTYHDVAQFLQNYYRTQYKSVCAEAMCLDGGSSSQLVYRAPDIGGGADSSYSKWIDARPSRITVPTALLISSN
jgi:hypothetical protein